MVRDGVFGPQRDRGEDKAVFGQQCFELQGGSGGRWWAKIAILNTLLMRIIHLIFQNQPTKQNEHIEPGLETVSDLRCAAVVGSLTGNRPRLGRVVRGLAWRFRAVLQDGAAAGIHACTLMTLNILQRWA